MNNDPYDVYSYENPDEFAAEMQHDREFDDYNDAYSYWEEKMWDKNHAKDISRNHVAAPSQPASYAFYDSENNSCYENHYQAGSDSAELGAVLLFLAAIVIIILLVGGPELLLFMLFII